MNYAHHHLKTYDFKPAVYMREKFVNWRSHPVSKLIILIDFGPVWA